MNHEAGVLLAGHEDDLQALWPYGRLLWRWRVDGGTARTRAAFDAAIQANPYVVSYLLDPDSIPFDRPPHFALRSREEAAYVRRLPTHSPRPMAPWNAQARPAPPSPSRRSADDEADRHSEAARDMGADAARRPMRSRDRRIHVNGFRTAPPVGS